MNEEGLSSPSSQKDTNLSSNEKKIDQIMPSSSLPQNNLEGERAMPLMRNISDDVTMALLNTGNSQSADVSIHVQADCQFTQI
jgi:hypothetical protein